MAHVKKTLPPALINEIVAARQAGMSGQDIATCLGLTYYRVWLTCHAAGLTDSDTPADLEKAEEWIYDRKNKYYWRREGEKIIVKSSMKA